MFIPKISFDITHTQTIQRENERISIEYSIRKEYLLVHFFYDEHLTTPQATPATPA
jgi:hypothetical protein